MEYFSVNRLELPKIISRLENQCSSPLGKDLVAQVQPLTDKNTIIALLEETTEAREIMRLYPTFSLGGIRDIRHSLWRVSRGAILITEELLAVLDTLEAVRGIKRFFGGIKEEFSHIRVWSNHLCELPEIQIAIKSAISEDGQVKDDASPELFRLRRRINEAQERIKTRLDNILRSPEHQKMLQELLITMRGDRYVLPVKQEYRSRFPGLVHDQSASGATLFIEPMSVVELNNDLRKFQLAEKREIEIILAALTQKIVSCMPELENTLQSLARLDFIFAKGRLSQAMDGCQPGLNSEGLMNIKKGRHPLITGEVVPIDIHLGREFRVLVITGPNTGGKTVALKTVGLLCLMAQCGLHIPAEPGTELAIFQSIFADIGDEQSIEQSLSTFSGHMTNIVGIIKKIKLPSLVLLDELGAGTDPVEGSALAIAILKKLHSLQAHTIATTHYSELKAFAYNTPGVENASVEFDPVTLRPTYRLLIGMPGRSNAFEIASRLGLDPEVVEEARSLISRDELEIGGLLEDLESKRNSLVQDQEETERIREELAVLQNDLEAEKRKLHEKEERIIAEAYRRSELIIKNGREEIFSLIKVLQGQMEETDRREQEKA
ncbi:MAG TPA: endonuclease MutS2, partial [Clostridia bacterium]|nr:endonuclease MutS2 [Clostridia bacterium]